jgi:antitoxin MazE
MERVQTSLAKWGTSLAVRLPKAVLDAARLKAGDRLAIEVRDRTIVIQPVADKPTLDELLAGITPENVHPATEWGGSVGKEEW